MQSNYSEYNRVMTILKSTAKGILKRMGYTVHRNRSSEQFYSEDGLQSIHNHDFIYDSAFLNAYQRGIQASAGVDSKFRWRAHVVLWAANCAAKLDGDFIECGVNKGFHSSAIMSFLDWNRLGKSFYLLDTFNGIDERFLTTEEVANGKIELNRKVIASGGYELNIESVVRNFAEWQRVHVIRGSVPETLPQVPSQKVAFLHLDMNCAIPEEAAAEFFWDRLVPGGIILLDDYAYRGYGAQKVALDLFAGRKGVMVLSLPTGQGLMIKPSTLTVFE